MNEHMENIGPMMKPLSEVCTITDEVCGTPSPELRQALEAAGVNLRAVPVALALTRAAGRRPLSAG